MRNLFYILRKFYLKLIGHVFTSYAIPIKHTVIVCVTFSGKYHHPFPVKEMKRKRKTLLNPWMSKGLQKSSKKKQKLYDRFLKNRTDLNEKSYKDYKSLFEILKEKSKQLFHKQKLTYCESNVKKTRDTIKEVVGR